MQASKEKEVELKTVWDLRCTAKSVKKEGEEIELQL